MSEPYGIHILRREVERSKEPRAGMQVGMQKISLDASHAAHALAAYDALIAASQWIDVRERLPSKGDVGRGFICTLQPFEGKPYTAEMCWLDGRKKGHQWQGDWSGVVTAWRPLPAAYTGGGK